MTSSWAKIVQNQQQTQDCSSIPSFILSNQHVFFFSKSKFRTWLDNWEQLLCTIVSQITSLTIVYQTIYSDADQRKYQSSVSLVFVWGIHWRPVNSPHKWPVAWKMFPFDDVIMSENSPKSTNPGLFVYPIYYIVQSTCNFFLRANSEHGWITEKVFVKLCLLE